MYIAIRDLGETTVKLEKLQNWPNFKIYVMSYSGKGPQFVVSYRGVLSAKSTSYDMTLFLVQFQKC